MDPHFSYVNPLLVSTHNSGGIYMGKLKFSKIGSKKCRFDRRFFSKFVDLIDDSTSGLVKF